LPSLSRGTDVECLVYDRYAWGKFELETRRAGRHGRTAGAPARRDQARQGKRLVDAGLGGRARKRHPCKRLRLRRSPVVISAMMSAAVERDAFDAR
jgi:hypothetical protein